MDPDGWNLSIGARILLPYWEGAHQRFPTRPSLEKRWLKFRKEESAPWHPTVVICSDTGYSMNFESWVGTNKMLTTDNPTFFHKNAYSTTVVEGGEQFDPNASMDFWSSKLGFNQKRQLVQAEDAAEAILEDVFSTPFSLGDRAHGQCWGRDEEIFLKLQARKKENANFSQNGHRNGGNQKQQDSSSNSLPKFPKIMCWGLKCHLPSPLGWGVFFRMNHEGPKPFASEA